MSVLATLGDDAAADQVAAAAIDAGLDLALTARRSRPTTPTLVFLLPSGERTIVTVAPAANVEGLAAVIAEAEADALDPVRIEAARALAPDAVYVSGSAPVTATFAPLATGLSVAQWPWGGPAGVPALGANILLVSRDDLPAEASADPFAAGAAMSDDRLAWVVVTEGAGGARAYDGARMLHAPAHPAAIVDGTGAGDAFAAGLIHAMLSGAEMTDALDHACAWGALAVEAASSIPPRAAGEWAKARFAPAKSETVG
ncbi:MAG: PfkB family carbohydrate kinase [Caulobacterales bacterium]|nr:PfkB family carbohydrate kinase [Caulobacterales bacterium]